MSVYPLGNMHPMGSGEDDYDDYDDKMDLIPNYKFKNGTEYTEAEKKKKYEDNQNVSRFTYDQLSSPNKIEHILDSLTTSEKIDGSINDSRMTRISGDSSAPLAPDGSFVVTQNPNATGGRDATLQTLKAGDLITTLQHEYTKSSDGYIKPTGYMNSVIHSVDSVIKDSSGKVTGVTTKGANNFDGDYHIANGQVTRSVTKNYDPSTVHNLFVGKVTKAFNITTGQTTYAKE